MARGERRQPMSQRRTEVDPQLVEKYRQVRQADRKRELFATLKEQNKDAKRARREEREAERKRNPDSAPALLIPKTKERFRRPDTTMVEPQDREICADEADDEYAAYFRGEVKPRILITTAPHPSFKTKQFIKEAMWLFPGAQYRPRKGYTIAEISQFCINRGITDLMVISDRLKQPYELMVSHLPAGPTAIFRMSNFVSHDELDNAAVRTEHYPELIFKNFDTRLGRRIGRILEALFPRTRDYEGRAVTTFHNQRDYVFVRTHRYIFDSMNEVRLQEMGPRVTLRLMTLQKGLFNPTTGEYEWHRKKVHDEDKLEWYL